MRYAPDVVKLGADIRSANDVPVGSVVEMALSAPVVNDVYLLAEGGLAAQADWPALADAIDTPPDVTTMVQPDQAIPFINIVGVRTCNNIFVMLCKKGIYTSPDGLVWTSRADVEFWATYKIELMGDGSVLVWGDNGHVLSTSNGTTWTTITTACPKALTYIDKLGSTYFVSNGVTLWSTANFTSFATVPSYTGAAVYGIYCGTKLSVIKSTTAYVISEDNGATWGSDIAFTFTDTTYLPKKGGGLVARVHGSTGAISYSTNYGETWAAFTPTGVPTTFLPKDIIKVPGLGHIITKGGEDISLSSVAYNTSTTDISATYATMRLHPLGPPYLYGRLYDNVEINSTTVLLYTPYTLTGTGGVAFEGSCFSVFPIPAALSSVPTGHERTPFVFFKRIFDYGTYSMSVCSGKQDDGSFLHTCVSRFFTYTGAAAAYNVNVFAYTENTDSSVFSFYFVRSLLASASDYRIKALQSYVKDGNLVLVYAHCMKNRTCTWPLGSATTTSVSEDIMTIINVDTAGCLDGLSWGCAATTTAQPLYFKLTDGSLFSYISSAGTLTWRAPSIGPDGSMYILLANDSTSYDLYISYDKGRTFSLVRAFTTQANYVHLGKGVTYFAGKYYSLSSSGVLYKFPSFNALATASAPTSYQVSTLPAACVNLTTVADGKLLAVFGTAGVSLIDPQDNITYLGGPTMATSVTCQSPVFYNTNMAGIFQSKDTQTYGVACGTSMPSGFFRLPKLTPTNSGMHMYIKGA